MKQTLTRGFKTLRYYMAKLLRRDVQLLMGATLVGSAITLLVQLGLGAVVAPEAFGEIRIIVGYFTVLSTLVLMGTSAPLGRLLIEKHAEARFAVYWHEWLRWWRVPALGMTLLLVGLAVNGLIAAQPAVAWPLAVVLASLPVWALTEQYQH
ncbi:MAG: hypothetical protein WAX89_03270, partial [Alphaproteobacteria bacterium]